MSKSLQVMLAAVCVVTSATLPTAVYAQATQAEVLAQRARLLDQQGRHDLASQTWLQLLTVVPNQPDALAALASFYKSKGDAVDERKYTALLQQVAPHDPRLTALASATVTSEQDGFREASKLADRHQYAEALDLYRKLFAGSKPSGPWALAYFETQTAVPNEYAQGVAGLRALHAEFPANMQYQLTLAKVLTYRAETRVEGVHMLAAVKGTSAQVAAARDAWRQAILWDTQGPVASETAQQYLARYPDAEVSAKMVAAAMQAQSHPAHAVVEGEAEQGEAYTALRKGDLDRAERLFTQLVSIPSQRGKAYMGLGYVAMDRQDFAKASAAFEKAQQNGVRSTDLRDALAQVNFWNLMNQGERSLAAHDADAALAAFQQASSLRPKSPEVMEATARTYMQSGQIDKALPLFEQAVRLQPDRLPGWTAWFAASLQAGRSSDVLANQRLLPPDIALKIQNDPDYIATLAIAELQSGSADRGRKLLAQLDKIEDADERSAAQLHCAVLLMNSNMPREAAGEALAVIRLAPDNVEAWKIIVTSEHAAGRDATALLALQHMSSRTYEAALKDIDFATAAAAVHQSLHQYSDAASILAGVRRNAGSDTQDRHSIDLSVASLAAAQGDLRDAVKMYTGLIQQTPDSIEAWNGLIVALHQAGQDDLARTQLQQMPQEVGQKLSEDAGFLQTIASIHLVNKDQNASRSALEQAASLYKERHQPTPFSLEAQLAWTELAQNDDAALGAQLRMMGQRNDKDAAAAQQISNLWGSWAISRSEREEKRGNIKRSTSLLEAAREAYPRNADIRRALAGNYIRNGNARAAVTLYEEIDWTRGTKDDYIGAISAAVASHRGAEGKQWLDIAMERWPGDDDILACAAEVARANGDTRKAKEYWQAILHDDTQNGLPAATERNSNNDPALPVPAKNQLERMLTPMIAKTTPNDGQYGSQFTGGSASMDALEALLPSRPRSSTDDVDTQLAQMPSKSPQHANPAPRSFEGFGGESNRSTTQAGDSSVTSWLAGSAKRNEETAPAAIKPAPKRISWVEPNRAQQSVSFSNVAWSSKDDATASAWSSSSADNMDSDPIAGLASDDTAVEPVHAMILSVAEKRAKQELDNMNASLSPWRGATTTVSSRSGTAGFDQLTRTELGMEASAVVGDSARLTIVAKPMFLNAGVTSATAQYSFGQSGVPLGNQLHYQSGVGGELQVATKLLSAGIGFTPSTFFVSNLVGNLDIHPQRLPITVGVYREAVAQTMISYAGERDPITGAVWGGVTATGVRAGFTHGTADSGFYANLSGARLSGTHVNDNSSVQGSAGAYFKFFANQYGVLKVGANVTGMHYAQNQQYFTYGQGGYFSPDSYLLVNAPITFEGRQRRFAYRVNGSLGMQTFTEGTPLAGSFIAAQTVTAPTTNANYNLNADVSYKLQQNWYIGTFLNVNNARDYQERAGGFSLRYMTRPQTIAEGSPTGLIDRKAPLPLIVP